MKKILLIIFLFLYPLSFILSSCATSFEPEIEKEMQTISGTLKYIGAVAYKDSHYFMESREDESIIYVLSEYIDLAKYKGEKVSVTGYYIQKNDANGEKAVFEIEGIQIIESEEENQNENTEEIDFSEQKFEYLNANLGIKFKFLGTWVIKNELNDNVVLRYENFIKEENENLISLPSIKIALLEETLELTENSEPNEEGQTANLFSDLYQWAETKYPSSALYENKIGPDALQSVRINFSDSKTIFYIKRNTNIYSIEFATSINENFAVAKTDFLNLINNFQFIAITKDAKSQITQISGPETEIQTETELQNSESNDEIITQNVSDTQNETEIAPQPVQNNNPSQNETEIKTESEPESSLDKGEAEDLEGYAYFESSPYKFGMQYPKNWYYANIGNASYGFNDTEIADDNSNVLIILQIIDGTIEEYKSMTKISDEEVVMYAERSSNQVYKISGHGKFKEYIEVMINSIRNLLVSP
ncbi:hypothetical protein A2335_01150 [Candidatus Peregrinibacteria bacterium RIFOXYB2_FULL_32_7]|nr:MAG: hypothetical protein A2335_01150 [Candidatus Peregrinibacteria bacterium RIFOXYB2_FULL_32_7]